MVPAWTMSPSLNFARAKSLASVSVSNILVARGLRGLADTPRFCTSKVTYQEYVISSKSFRTSRDVRPKARDAHQSGSLPTPLQLWIHGMEQCRGGSPSGSSKRSDLRFGQRAERVRFQSPCDMAAKLSGGTSSASAKLRGISHSLAPISATTAALTVAPLGIMAIASSAETAFTGGSDRCPL